MARDISVTLKITGIKPYRRALRRVNLVVWSMRWELRITAFFKRAWAWIKGCFHA